MVSKLSELRSLRGVGKLKLCGFYRMTNINFAEDDAEIHLTFVIFVIFLLTIFPKFLSF